MDGSFWTNTIWFIALGATSVAALVVIFVKTPERKKTFAFWFAVLGLTYWMEVMLVLILNAYTYQPMIVQDPFFDAVLGNIFSQVSVSSSAVLICVFALSNGWLLGFSVAYFLVDLLFSALGVYVHNWYQSVYTLAGFLIYGGIVKYWYKKIFDSPSKKIFYPTLFLSAFAVSANLHGTVLRLLDIRIFHSAIFADPSRDHTATSLIYQSIIILISIALHKSKARWTLKALVFLLILIGQYGLIQAGVIVVKPGWWLFVMLFDLLGFYGWTVLMDRSLRSESGRYYPNIFRKRSPFQRS